ncbi:MAG: hypothetical protein OXF79_17425 [Chloroflexi bacterium]|nr:hypothetical protein [Chloroflexota bacterium]
MSHDDAGRLSPAHVAALVASPEAVCLALPATDVLTARDQERSGVETMGGAASAAVDADEADRRLAARMGEAVSETLLTSEEPAARTGLSFCHRSDLLLAMVNGDEPLQGPTFVAATEVPEA